MLQDNEYLKKRQIDPSVRGGFSKAPVKDQICQRMAIQRNTVRLYPFFPDLQVPQLSEPREKNSFLYVSDGNPYKNHLLLLDAFEIVWAQHHQAAQLYLTVSPQYPEVLLRVESLAQKGYPIFNLGLISREDLGREYLHRGFLIYPSLVESFGLGLIEAAQMGMPIIAADLPYVHAVVSPLLTFDPTNSTSISQSIQKALKEKSTLSSLKLVNAMPDILKRLR